MGQELDAGFALWVETVAASLLDQAECHPGTSMRTVAHRLGHRVHEREGELPVRGLSARTEASSHIVVVASGYSARDEFTTAHELMELHLPAVWKQELHEDMKERLCDRGASALLLPAYAFRRSALDLDMDLPALRRQWRNASWDVLCRRLVDVGVASSAAAWDSLHLAWRYGSTDLDLAEEEALGHVYAGLGRARVKLGDREVRAWRLGGPGLGRAVSVGR